MFTFPVASTKYNVKESAWHADNEKKNRQKANLNKVQKWRYMYIYT